MAPPLTEGLSVSSIQTYSLDKQLDLLSIHASNPERYPFLLESTAIGPQGQFNILFAFPQQQQSITATNLDNNFLNQLNDLFVNEQTNKAVSEELPYHGGWFVYLSYELAEQIEPTLKLPKGSDDELLACFVRCPAAIIFDHHTKKTTIVVEQAFSHLMDELQADVNALNQDPSVGEISGLVKDIAEENPQTYISHLSRIHQYIVDGDVFQVNLSRLWQAKAADKLSAIDIYRSLRENNPAPFAGLMSWQGQSIISSSPERLVRSKNGVAETRPIAGTRPRAKDNDQQADKAKLEELIGHPKERAEHVMLIDLERNDLGRICQPGSIEVNELMCLESYAHVHHIVSNVRGRLQEGISPGDIIRAVFPGGTITGCPKVRCMEIIAELEQAPRGPYTGSFGYLNRNGDMDLNILIRTIKMVGKHVSFRAGAGIVVDSVAEKEVEETRAKAKGMLSALGYDFS